MENKCLLIGGAGFIGMNLAICLVDAGYDITVYDCIKNPYDEFYASRIQYIQGDYFQEVIDDEIIKMQDMVVLLTCSVGPKTSMDEPEACYGQDIVRMIKLLEQMRKCNVNELLFISSGGTVYGNHKEDILSEDIQTLPINHYGIMKLTQEKILLMYNSLYGMKNVIFRLANPYGVGQRVSSGIGAVTTFLDRIVKEKEIMIYGRGEVVRDYIFIEDAINMICLFLKCRRAAKGIPIYNIGTGWGTSIMQVIKVIEEVTGKTAKIIFQNERSIDVQRNVLDTKKIQSIIGEYSCLTLKEGINIYYNMLEKGNDVLEQE